MNKKNRKKLLALGGLVLGTVLLTSCTANFCSNADKASMAYPYEQGVTVYVTKQEYETLRADPATKAVILLEEEWSAEAMSYGLPAIAGPAYNDPDLNDQVYKYVPFTAENGVGLNNAGDYLQFNSKKAGGLLSTIITNAKKAGYSLPSVYYFAYIDDFALKASTTKFLDGRYSVPEDFYNLIVSNPDRLNALKNVYVGSESNVDFTADGVVAVNPYFEVDPSEAVAQIDTAHSILRESGYVKFTGKDNAFYGYLDEWNKLIRSDSNLGFSQLGDFDVPSADFYEYYKKQVSTKVESIRSCIATRQDYFGHYGTYADWRVAMEQKNYGYAWSKGFLEGLLVFPVTWLLDTMAYSFDPGLTGMGQIWALVLVTLIIRGILLAVSWSSTMDSQKMQALQPELAKIQAKYPNANTNQAEKQRLAQEQHALYRKNGIKPFRQLIFLVIQFPVFICVWSGLQGSAALSTGEILNMRLSDSIKDILFNTSGTWYWNTFGWWTALVLFILMAATQVMAMLTPRIIAHYRNKKVPKLTENPAAKKQGNTMRMVSYIMIIFTIIMGFTLPSAMGVYWLIGGLISITQTLITQLIIGNPNRKKGKKK